MKVLVLGGGIAGVTTAYYLGRDGHEVILVEANEAVGLDASAANYPPTLESRHLLHIGATRAGRAPNFDLLGRIAREAFMPLAYGGGIRSVEQAQRVSALGFEKLVRDAACFTHSDGVNRTLLLKAAQFIRSRTFHARGSQAQPR